MQLQNKFKIRCSCIGQIMTSPKNKSDILSQTCLSYVQSWLKEQPEFYNRREEFSSKYTTKGNNCEDGSIEFASDYFGWGMVDKNTEFMENEYLTGTADVLLAKSVEDIKNSWSQKTFPLFDTCIKNKDYEWQLQGYMPLYGKESAGLIYTLMDAPESIIEKEARSKMYQLGMEDLEEEFYNEVKASMTYSHLPDHLRIKRFTVEYDREAMITVFERVEQIRDYISSI